MLYRNRYGRMGTIKVNGIENIIIVDQNGTGCLIMALKFDKYQGAFKSREVVYQFSF